MTVIDYHCHWYPEAYYEFIRGRDRYPRVELVEGMWKFEQAPGASWSFSPEQLSLETYFDRLDAAGIDIGVASPNMLANVCHLDLSEAREIMALLNEETARAQREYPDRFIGLAMLPMQDVTAALETLEDAVLRLGLRGVCMLSNIAGRPIVTAETLPIYTRMEELGVPLVIHPAIASMAYDLGLNWAIEVGISWMWDTSAAALSLILSGVLDQCPDLKVLHPQLGGMIPYVLGRLTRFMDTWVRHAERLPGDPLRAAHGGGVSTALEHPVTHYLQKRFYTDIAVRTPGALALAIETYGLDHVLFGSDFPFFDPGEHIDFARNAFASTDLDAIMTNSMTFPASRANAPNGQRCASPAS